MAFPVACYPRGSKQSVVPFVGALDAYTSNLAGVWSARRRLVSSYSGALVRIRRSSDDAELDIGYAANGALDTAAITAFVGSNSAYATKVYDQVTSNDFIQSTALIQPRIVNAGALDMAGSSPAIYFASTGSTAILTASALSGTAGTLYGVQKKDNDPGPGGDAIFSAFGASGSRDHMPFSDGNVYFGAMATTRQSCGNPTTSLSIPFLMTCVSASNSWILRLQSADFYSTTGTTVGFGTPQIGGLGPEGHFVECAFYNTAHGSTEWANLEPVFQP